MQPSDPKAGDVRCCRLDEARADGGGQAGGVHAGEHRGRVRAAARADLHGRRQAGHRHPVRAAGRPHHHAGAVRRARMAPTRSAHTCLCVGGRAGRGEEGEKEGVCPLRRSTCSLGVAAVCCRHVYMSKFISVQGRASLWQSPASWRATDRGFLWWVGVTTEEELLAPDNHIRPNLYTNALPDMLSMAKAAVPA